MAKTFGNPLSESAILGKVNDVTSLRDVKKVLNNAGKLPYSAVLTITNRLETAVEHRQGFTARKRENAVNTIREFRLNAMKR